MNRQEIVQKRWKHINRLFILLIFTVLVILIVREYQIFQSNISFFNDNLYDAALLELENEIENRYEEIESVKADIDFEFHDDLEQIVKDVDFFASESLKSLDSSATLSEKRERYIETIYQYDLYENNYLFFAMDLEGNSYLSGLTKNLEGTNISYLQDVKTGSYFVLDMIDIINSSEDQQGFITYHWINEVGGEHLEKTSFIYYNEDVDLFIGTGLYETDYTDQVKEELFNRISSYYNNDEDYMYIISFDGEVIYHPHENFDTQALLDIRTIDGEVFHDVIVTDLQNNESTYIEYRFEFEGRSDHKTGYVKRIDDWNLYIGKSLVFENLEIEQQNYFNTLIVDFIIFNVLVLVTTLGLVILIKKLINRNFADVTDIFEEQNETIKQASYRDILTGLYNRNYYDYAMKKISSKWKDSAVFMIDANGLKLINDAYGHTFGDKLLVSLATIINKVFEDSIIFRWGGDEFVVIKEFADYDPKDLVMKFQKETKNVKIKNFTLSASIGFAVSNEEEKNIYDLINIAERMMYDNKSFDSLSTKRILIDNILNTLYNNFNFEEKHSENVMKYSLSIGSVLELSKPEMNKLRLAAIMHDVGKIGIPDHILNKTEKLTQEDFDVIKKHPEKGMRILSAYPELSEYGNYAFTHHENFDGTGYPRGLKAEDIPLFSRIICIADAFDAITSTRVYKKSLSKEDAITELINNKGTQFDPDLVDAFIKSME